MGTLRGFDVYVNMVRQLSLPSLHLLTSPFLSSWLKHSVSRTQVLEDVIEYEDTPEGRVETKLDQILLNGNNIALLVPGGGGADGPSGA